MTALVTARAGRCLSAGILQALLVSCGAAAPSAQPTPTPQGFSGVKETAVFDPWLLKVDAGGLTFNYYLYLPDDYAQTSTAYPLLIVLHGDGGDRSYVPGPTPQNLDFGPLKALYLSSTTLDPGGRSRLNAHVRRSFVVYPKVPRIDDNLSYRLSYWNPDALDILVQHVSTAYRIDPDRLYITGPSMGGGGTFGYARSKPGRAAAIIPICNGLYQGWGAEQLRGLPIWLFHNFGDTHVPYQTSINPTVESLMPGVVDVMQGYPFAGENQMAASDYTVSYDPRLGLGPWRAGVVYPSGLVTYTLYAATGHDAWTRTYADDEVWEWLYAQRRNRSQ